MIYTRAHNAPKECVLGNRLVNYSVAAERKLRTSSKSGITRFLMPIPRSIICTISFSQADLNKNDTMGFDLRVGG
jgi:hypothetical protein